ncbi:MAG: hypothetical protein JWN32_4445 [Solirubrobacterales bacterium]|jgi:hypothetical protein|nr:hypothetical protein [Solirubrobacterales bacterium]
MSEQQLSLWGYGSYWGYVGLPDDHPGSRRIRRLTPDAPQRFAAAADATERWAESEPCQLIREAALRGTAGLREWADEARARRALDETDRLRRSAEPLED